MLIDSDLIKSVRKSNKMVKKKKKKERKKETHTKKRLDLLESESHLVISDSL